MSLMSTLLGGEHATSIMSPEQLMYSLNYTMQMSPYVEKTNRKLRDIATDTSTSYKPLSVVDFNNIMKKSGGDMIDHQLGLQMKNLQHSNERHSSGRFFREMMAGSQAEGQKMQLENALFQNERAMQLAAIQNMQNRQYGAMDMLSSKFSAPMQVRTGENIVQQTQGMI